MTEKDADMSVVVEDSGPHHDVYIANVNPGLVRHEFLLSLLQLMVHDIQGANRMGHIVPRVAGPLLDVYRNMCVQHFLSETEDSIFASFDSDMVLPSNTLEVLAPLCTEETPVISGLYFMVLEEGIRPAIFNLKPKEQESGRIVQMMTPEETWPEDEIVECDASGAGVMLVHRSLLEKMAVTYGDPEPWFACHTFDHVKFGEDFTFGMRVKEMGHRWRVHTGLICGHVKNYILTETFAREFENMPGANNTNEQLKEIIR